MLVIGFFCADTRLLQFLWSSFEPSACDSSTHCIVHCIGCRANQISGQGTGDVITSPLYPRKYRALTVCEWTIRASRSFNKILVELPDLNMEGFSNRKQLIFMSLFKLTVFSSVFFLRICIYDETRFMLVFLNVFFKYLVICWSLSYRRFSWVQLHCTANRYKPTGVYNVWIYV